MHEEQPSTTDPHGPLGGAFDPEAFRSLGHQVVDLLADALGATGRGEAAVRSGESPQEAFEFWEAQLAGPGSPGSPQELARLAIERSFRSHHPRNLGHQVGPVLPAVAAMELVAGLLDTGNGVFEVGNPATPMERVVLMDLARRCGLPAGADGVLTSGGSLGNLTAMLAMRQAQTGSWDTGSTRSPLAVLVSTEAHYCVTRNVKIMGWGEGGAIHIPVDGDYRLRADALEEGLGAARGRGVEVIGVVASAGSTATGRIDPLDEIGRFCEEHGLWFHVDAAHAGAYVFSEKARPLLRGIERADSLVIDFHKMLLSPSLLTAVLFRDGRDSFKTFAQHADYLWREDESTEWWDAAKRTLECTRPMLGLRAFAALQSGRDGLLERYIDHTLAITHAFADLIEAAPDFELLTRPESNIVCYRFTPAGVPGAELDALNARLREKLVQAGGFYIVQVEKHGRLYLRSAVMNPHVELSTCEALLDAVREAGDPG